MMGNHRLDQTIYQRHFRLSGHHHHHDNDDDDDDGDGNDDDDDGKEGGARYTDGCCPTMDFRLQPTADRLMLGPRRNDPLDFIFNV